MCGRQKKSALLVDMSVLIPRNCKWVVVVDLIKEFLTIRIPVAKRRWRIHDILHCEFPSERCSTGIEAALQCASCKHGWRINNWKLHYTYTPTEQNKATTPKPPRILAKRATAGSFTESLSVGRLDQIVSKVFGTGYASNIRWEIKCKAKGGQKT